MGRLFIPGKWLSKTLKAVPEVGLLWHRTWYTKRDPEDACGPVLCFEHEKNKAVYSGATSDQYVALSG